MPRQLYLFHTLIIPRVVFLIILLITRVRVLVDFQCTLYLLHKIEKIRDDCVKINEEWRRFRVALHRSPKYIIAHHLKNC